MIAAFSTTKLKEPWMSPLPESVDIAFEQFVQALPEDYEAMAYEFRAFACSRKIKSPLQLLQVVMLYCGVWI